MRIQIDQEDFNRKLNEALKGMAIDLQESLKGKLTKVHGKDTGVLQSGIMGSVEGTTVTINMPAYGKYVEFGRPPGKMPPVEALEGWTRRKLGDAKLAWAVAMHIKKWGTTPYPFIRNTFSNDLIPIINRNLKSAFKR